MERMINTNLRPVNSNNGNLSSGYNFARFGQMPKQYNFFNRYTLSDKVADGDSLAQLLDCLRLEYSDTLLTPRWKNFKSQNLKWEQKRRLNNIIWRAWHMQFQKHRNLPFCKFAIPFLENMHNKPQAIVVEGEHWRRRLDAIASEYKRWRCYFGQTVTPPETETQVILGNDDELSQQLNDASNKLIKEQLIGPGNDSEIFQNSADVFMLPDTLFSSLAPVDDFNSTDERLMDTADLIQPTLDQLQPSVADLLATMEDNDNYFLKKLDETPPFSFTAQPQGLAATQNLTQSQKNKAPISYHPIDEEHYKHVVPANVEINQNVTNHGHQELGLMNVSNYNCSAIDANATGSSNSIQNVPRADNVHLAMHQNRFNQQSYQLHNISMESTTTFIKTSNNQLSELENQIPQDSFHVYPNVDNRQRHPNLGAGTTNHNNHPPKLNNISEIQTRFRPRAPDQSSKSPSTPAHILYNPVNNQQAMVSEGAVPESPGRGFSKENQPIPSQSSYTFWNEQTQDSSDKFLSQRPAAASQERIAANTATDNSFLARLLTNSNFTQESRQYQRHSIERHYVAKPVPIAPAQNKVQMNNSPSLGNLQYDWNQTRESSKTLDNVTISTECFAIFGCITPIRLHHLLIYDLLNIKNESTSLPVSPTHTGSIAHVVEPTGFAKIESHSGYMNSIQMTSKANMNTSSESQTKPSVTNEEYRRRSHQSSEQKRRGNIKLRFEKLQSLVPSLTSVHNARNSKATILQKSIDYCKTLTQEKQAMQAEIQRLKSRILELNEGINKCHQQLPVTGATVTQQRADQLRQKFDEYVKKRTLSNYKFWIFSIIIRPLFESYSNTAVTSSYDEFYRTMQAWMDQHCTLVQLRPVVMAALCQLSTDTDILSNPSLVPVQAVEAAKKLLVEN
ncbi:Carbohydrate-responsive element-binding protein [Trichoplax sp. H2]|nr:Carbohydrate-responsive element-binding protein [Trichoplax sp. H2]|eukprot:RDD41124.1 Carbohydrate-responsive element-binding protein [Trichoplax sp. H2]